MEKEEQTRLQELEVIINPKQRKFLELFLATGNGAESIRLAGYRCGTAHRSNLAFNMLQNPNNAEYFELLKKYSRETMLVTATRLLEAEMQIAFFDASEHVDEDGNFLNKAAFKRAGKNIKSISVNKKTGQRKVEFYDKQTALERLERHMGWFEKDNEQKAPEGVQFYLPDHGRDRKDEEGAE